MKKAIALILCALVMLQTFSLVSCRSSVAVDLMSDVVPNRISVSELDKTDTSILYDFSVRLFKESYDNDKNTLISPVSVLFALGMTANGMEGETLEQTEEVLGLPLDKLNTYLYSYLNSLPCGEKYKLGIANSLWLKDDEKLKVNGGFLQTNANFYSAGIYKSPFDDSTLSDINKWVKNNTDGMIEKIIDEIPEHAVMYLVNALAFDAQWQTTYKEHQVWDGDFTKEDGTKRDIELMHSSESLYLEDEGSTGFIKYYKDSKYAFVALLPKEGVTLSEYLSSLDSKALYNMLNQPFDTLVNASIPKFEAGYDIELSEALKNMGITDAFDFNKADFSALGTYSDGNIAINRVLHKTYILINEIGTRAGAVTAVELLNGSAAPQEYKEVCLDRPFLYMIIDGENSLPLFIGTVTDIT